MKRRSIFVVFLLLKLLDVLTTMVNIYGANMTEGNPIISPVISVWGFEGLIVISILGSGILAWAFDLISFSPKVRNVLLALTFLFWGVMPVINFLLLGATLGL